MRRRKLLLLVLAAAMTVSLMACSKPSGPGSSTISQAEGGQGQAAVGEEPEAAQNQESTENQPESGGQDFSGITLTLAYNTTGDVADALVAQLESFESLTGCKIEIEKLSENADESGSMMQVRAATGNLPDIWQNAVGANLRSISPQENCYDLSGQPWLDNIDDTYRAVVTDSGSGAVYAIPSITSNVAGVFYNKKVYSELSLELPRTWEELLANCEAIRKNSDKTPCASPYNSPSGVQILFLAQYYYVQEENPDFAEQYTSRELDLHNSGAYMRGLEKMYDLWEKGYQTEDPLALSFEDAAVQLANGEAAMLVCRTNVMATVAQMAPELIDDVGFFPLPDENPDKLGVATWMPTGWVMNKNIPAEKEACALALFEYLTTSQAIDVYCTKTTPTGAFMVKNAALPDTVSTAVKEAQSWLDKASSPVMEYFCDIKGANMATILQMVGTGEYTPQEGVAEIEKDNAIDAQQKGIEGW